MAEREAVIDRLARRDAQRLEQIKRKQKADLIEPPLKEQTTLFHNVFKEKSTSIQNKIDEIEIDKEPAKLQPLFDVIKKEIMDLQKIVLNSSLILKEYDMKKYLAQVQSLETICFQMEEKYIPRKRFGFSKKKIEKVAMQSSVPHKKDTTDSPKNNKSKWEDTLFGFDKKENEILTLAPEELYERDLSVRNTKNCTIALRGVLGTLHLSNLNNCVILCGPVCTSIFLEKCTNCKIVVMCQQLRMHTSKSCDIYLHVTCKGIVEDCTAIRTAPFNLIYDGLEKDIKNSSLDEHINKWNDLDDFNWLSLDTPSPNWSIIPENERITDWSEWWSKYPTK